MSRVTDLLAIAVLLLVPLIDGSAQIVRKEDDLPKSGNLSTSIISGASNAKIPDPFGSVDFSGTEKAPITGSVSRVDADTWRLRVFNNAKDTYTVNLGVVQRDLDGRTVKSDNFSYTLKSGGSQEQDIQSSPAAMGADLNLRSYHKHGSKAPTPSATALPAGVQ